MAWKHLHGRTTELHSAQSLRREPVHSHSRALRCVTRPRERGLSPVGVGRSLGHALLLRRWAVDVLPCGRQGEMSCRSSS